MVKTTIFGVGFSIKIWLKFFGAVVLQPRFYLNKAHRFKICGLCFTYKENARRNYQAGASVYNNFLFTEGRRERFI